MTNSRIAVPFLVLIALMVGCQNTSNQSGGDSGRLTKDKAQRALNKWIAARGEISVQGIQELPQQNAARVDVNFTHYRFNSMTFGAEDHSGPGTAMFSHYTDGRWVLSTMSFRTSKDIYNLTELNVSTD